MLLEHVQCEGAAYLTREKKVKYELKGENNELRVSRNTDLCEGS